MDKLTSLRDKYNKAFDRFEEILRLEKNEVVRDSAIKRFEFTFDLSWKLLKEVLKTEKGIACQSPKDCFREAYRQGIISYEELWIQMTDWRNESAHNYNETFVDDLYSKLPSILESFRTLLSV